MYFYFTFGCGNPNEGLAQMVEAGDEAEAREIMSEKHGNRWAFCYSSEQWKKFINSGIPMEKLILNILRKDPEEEKKTLMPYILAPNIQFIPEEIIIIYCVIDPDYETEEIVKMFSTREKAREYIKNNRGVFNSELEIKEREVY
jgi:hypothetical protein